MEVEDNLNSSEGSFDLATVNGVSRWLIFTEEIKFVCNLGIGMDGNRVSSPTSAREEILYSSVSLHCSKDGNTHMKHNDIWYSMPILKTYVMLEFAPSLSILQGETLSNQIKAQRQMMLGITANGL